MQCPLLQFSKYTSVRITSSLLWQTIGNGQFRAKNLEKAQTDKQSWERANICCITVFHYFWQLNNPETKMARAFCQLASIGLWSFLLVFEGVRITKKFDQKSTWHQYLTNVQSCYRCNHGQTKSYRNFHFNEFVANALPDNIGSKKTQPLTSWKKWDEFEY